MSDADRANLVAAQRELDAKRANLKAAKDAAQSAADAQAKAEIARRLGRVSDAAAADPAKEEDVEARIAQHEATTKRAAQAMRQDSNPSRTAKRPTQRRRKAAKRKDGAAEPKPNEQELLAAVVQAKTTEEVFTAVSRWCWAQTHDDVCPATRIANTKRVVAELEAVRKESSKALPVDLPGILSGIWAVIDDELKVLFSDSGKNRICVEPVEIIHNLWLTARQRNNDPNLPHPLASVVAVWQRLAAVQVKADKHPNAILSESLRDAQRIQDVLPIALDRDTPLGTLGSEPEQGYLLPEWRPMRSIVPRVSWLTLYDLTGTGPMQTRGRGAPLAQRLFVEVLTAVHVGDRDPEWITAPPITLRDLFEWCWPRWYDRKKGVLRGGYQRNKHLPLLRRALVELDNFRIRNDHMDRRLIRVDDLPNSDTALDAPIRFHVRHLPGSDRGPAIDRVAIRRWGLQSAPAYRSKIRLAYLWDEAKGRNNGHRIYATRPVVARVAGPGSPLIGADGRVLRNRRGATVTNWNDSRAVALDTDGKPVAVGKPPAFERNPAADRVPALGPDDMIRLAFDDELDLPSASRRKRLERSREALTNLEAVGEVVLEHVGEGMRIIEPRPDTWSR